MTTEPKDAGYISDVMTAFKNRSPVIREAAFKETVQFPASPEVCDVLLEALKVESDMSLKPIVMKALQIHGVRSRKAQKAVFSQTTDSEPKVCLSAAETSIIRVEIRKR